MSATWLAFGNSSASSGSSYHQAFHGKWIAKFLSSQVSSSVLTITLQSLCMCDSVSLLLQVAIATAHRRAVHRRESEKRSDHPVLGKNKVLLLTDTREGRTAVVSEGESISCVGVVRLKVASLALLSLRMNCTHGSSLTIYAFWSHPRHRILPRSLPFLIITTSFCFCLCTHPTIVQLMSCRPFHSKEITNWARILSSFIPFSLISWRRRRDEMKVERLSPVMKSSE